MEAVRVDRWLSAARLFKSRTQATQACAGGHVKREGQNLKAHQLVAVGDELVVQTPRQLRIVEILGLAEKRLSPPLARELYDDHSPEIERPQRRELDPFVPQREVGTGRPTKRDRRALGRLRGRD